MGKWPEKVGPEKIASTQFLVPGFDKSRAILGGVDFFNFGESGPSGKAASLSSTSSREGRTISSHSSFHSRPVSYKYSILEKCLAEPHSTTRG